MGDEPGQDYAVPRYRDPGRSARIVEARQRGERIGDIVAREGASPRRIRQIRRDTRLSVRSPAAPPPRPRAGAAGS